MSDDNRTLRSGEEPPPPPKNDGDRPVAGQKTLYAARLSDPRDRAAQPRERARGRAVQKAEATSDVTRFRGVLAATIAGAGSAALAAVLVPPPGGHVSPGPLSRPHAKAQLACASCHVGTAEKLGSGQAEVPSSACVTCHGAHPSTRPGHERAKASGLMRCSTCHSIHSGDQGVTFWPDKPPVRFAPGAEAEAPAVAFRPAKVVTVAIPSAGSCKRCHDLESSHDPIVRCLIAGQETLGDARPVVCFDEHQPAYPPDAPANGRRLPRGPALGSGVCAGQHTEDRAVAWDAAREAAAAVPTVERATSSGGPSLWTGLGLAAAALAFAGVRGGHAIAARRKKKAEAPAPAGVLEAAPRVRLPQIDVNTCLGCYACVDACPYDVLEIEKYVAVVARPEACCGLTLCEQRCPNGSLRITDGDPIGDRPRLAGSLESLDVPGLFLAGDVTGLPLIKNAIHQGARAAEEIASGLKGERAVAGALDLVIVGAGPAGISAALRAKELGLAFEVIEQGDVAQSIQSFPRGKLVFDQPLELPVTGKLWLKESTKEELLSHWLRIVRKEKLPIFADTRMTACDRGADGVFQVITEPREGGASTERRARRVLLAIGQRGSPRRLSFDLSPDVEPRVHYHLADARSFEGLRVIVCGLGDVAMEAAIALSRQPGTTVTVVHRGDGFSRGKSRNITETKRLAESGRITLHFGSELSAIARDRAVARGKSGEARIEYDAVLVLIGSIPPWSVLRGAGVKTTGES